MPDGGGEGVGTYNEFVEHSLHSRFVDASAEGAEFCEEFEEVERHVRLLTQLHLVHRPEHVITHEAHKLVRVNIFLQDKQRDLPSFLNSMMATKYKSLTIGFKIYCL